MQEDGEYRARSPQVLEREFLAYSAVPRICHSRDRGKDLLSALAQTKER
jgi:hypothetical protein